MTKTVTCNLVKSCRSVDKYDEVDELGLSVKDTGMRQPLVGTIYVDKELTKGAKAIKVTVEVEG